MNAIGHNAPQESRAATDREARFVWGLVPRDCKSSLIALKRSRHWDHARPVILAEAAAGLKLIGKYSLLDVCSALELAAEHYLEDHADLIAESRSPITDAAEEFASGCLTLGKRGRMRPDPAGVSRNEPPSVFHHEP